MTVKSYLGLIPPSWDVVGMFISQIRGYKTMYHHQNYSGRWMFCGFMLPGTHMITEIKNPRRGFWGNILRRYKLTISIHGACMIMTTYPSNADSVQAHIKVIPAVCSKANPSTTWHHSYAVMVSLMSCGGAGLNTGGPGHSLQLWHRCDGEGNC